MILHTERLLYLHPSKTAGTSVETALMSHVTGLPAEELTPRIAQLYGCWDGISTQHFPMSWMLDRYPFVRHWRKIVTVRHPYTRTISEFKYQLAGFRGKLQHPAYAARDINLALTSGILWKNCFAWHGQPQCNYLAEDVQILRYETLAEDWERVIGFCPLPRVNVSLDAQQFELTDAGRHAVLERFPNDFYPLGYSA